jgi:hypothetical protein
MHPPPDWPTWSQRLPPDPTGRRRAEGGRRLQSQAQSQAQGQRPIDPATPLVSYITVVRNARHTLERTLASVRAQTWPAVEHIVLDGLSDDGTLALIEQHADQLDYYASEPDQGLYDALNKAIPLARGALICVLNADDWLTEDAAALAARAYQAAGAPPSHLVLSAAWLMKPKGRRLWLPGALDVTAYLRCANICHNGVYATPGAMAATGPYSTGLRIAADFHWLMASVDAGVSVSAIDEPTVHYSPGGLSSNVQQHTRDCASVLALRFPCLSEDEVWGLLHAFHSFRGNLAPFASTRPPHIGRFLQALARRHAQQGELMALLAQTCAHTLQHPDDHQAAGQLSTGEKLRRGWRKLRMHWRRRRHAGLG